MKKEKKIELLFEDDDKEQSQLTRLRREKLNVQSRIDKVLETLNDLNESLRKLNAEISLLERQINLFQ